MTLADELQKLQSLHDQGALTSEELQVAKAKVLAGQPQGDGWNDGWGEGHGSAQPRVVGGRTHDVRQWALFLHLSQFAGFVIPLGGMILPIVLWQMKKEEWPEIDLHGRAIMNWILSEILYLLICLPLCIVLIGFPLMGLVLLAGLIFPIVGALKANEGILWKYPASIPFF